jgi:hypothetical protein
MNETIPFVPFSILDLETTLSKENVNHYCDFALIRNATLKSECLELVVSRSELTGSSSINVKICTLATSILFVVLFYVCSPQTSCYRHYLETSESETLELRNGLKCSFTV